MNIEAFMTTLVASIPSDNLDQLLQAISDEVHEDGQCPFCGCEDMPVNADGKAIEGDDVSMASEWHEVHDDECPAALLEQAIQKQHVK